nr:LacI family DNA-binding transcriptional regulator [Verrucosispora sioxanthis]
MTGVSQATVSLVLNGRDDGSVRIAPETRERVLGAIRATGYVADPVARRLAARHNRILGVFTYEPVFPAGTGDFYHPFLVGIEESAERLGCDLLLLTSAPVTDGRRRIFHDDNRLRLADGCVLLGRSLDRDELGRLVAEGHPFVSVGRRDDAGGPVPYVGADYVTATADVVRRALDAGHTRLAYLGQGAGPESHTDRFAGYRAAPGRPARRAAARRGHRRGGRGVRRRCRPGHRRRRARPDRARRPVHPGPGRPDPTDDQRPGVHRLPDPPPRDGVAGRRGAHRTARRDARHRDPAAAAVPTGRRRNPPATPTLIPPSPCRHWRR